MGDTDAVTEETATMPPTYDEARGLTEAEPAVKIQPSETKVEIGKPKEEQGFKGLTKDELMKYANDPFWVRLRWVLFGLFWVIWLAMLVASIIIIVYAPKCPSPEPKQWWQKGAIYTVDVAGFPDTDGDGKGDLKGVEQNLEHLVMAGVGAAYFPSLLAAHDYEKVSGGTIEEWDSLAMALQERNIRVVVGLAPSSTAPEHLWKEEQDTKYKGFYKTADSTDLDLTNSAVATALEGVLEYWMKHEVDGFVVSGLGREQKSLLTGFRRVLEGVSLEQGEEKVLVVKDQDWDTEEVDGVCAGTIVHMALSEDLLPEGEMTAASLKTSLDTLSICPWEAITIKTTSHGDDMVDALQMVKMLLPATVVTAPGEELGLAQMDISKIGDEGTSAHLALYSLLATKVRHQDAILFGDMGVENTFVLGNVFGLTRVKKGSPGYILLINFGTEESVVDLNVEAPVVPESIRVLEAAGVAAVSPVQVLAEGEIEVKRFDSNAVPLAPRQAKIFNFVPKFD